MADEMMHSCDRHEPARRCYTICKCRCVDCREAHRQYAAGYSRRKAYGQVLFVDPAPVVSHVQRLADAGIGFKRVAKLAGVSNSTMWKLVRGQSTKVRPETARAIMSVEPVLADGARIPAGQYQDALRLLQRRGWPKRELARWITGNPDCVALQNDGELMRVSTAKRIVTLVNLIEADRVRCMRCGVKLRGRVTCRGGCRERQLQPS